MTAEDERLEAILPLVKKYGAAVIGLPNDEEEIPEEPARRLELTRKLIARRHREVQDRRSRTS